VTCRRKSTGSAQHLVDWCHVDAGIWHSSLFFRNERQERQFNEELLWSRIVKKMSVVIPFASFQEDTIDDTAFFGFRGDLGVVDVISDNEIEGKFIYSDGVSSGVVLDCSRKEGLWEEESGHPEDIRRTSGDPSGQEIDSGIAIFNPRSEWLERQETFLGPSWWHSVVKDSVGHQFKIFTHNDLSDKSSSNLLQHDSHICEKSVISDALLE